jgi:hypothetical protein
VEDDQSHSAPGSTGPRRRDTPGPRVGRLSLCRRLADRFQQRKGGSTSIHSVRAAPHIDGAALLKRLQEPDQIYLPPMAVAPDLSDDHGIAA